MRSLTHLHAVAFLSVLTFGTAAVFASGASINAARSAAQGTVVTVDGVVSVPSGALAPNDDGFAIQDGKVGIYIHDSLGGNYQLGQTVTVTGVLGDNFGQVLGVYPTTVSVTGSHPVHPAKPTATGNIGESTEGRLVSIRGTVTDAVFADPPYGALFHLDDGSGPVTVFVYTGTGADLSDLGPGDDVSVVGLSGQFIDHYEVNPRSQADIVKH